MNYLELPSFTTGAGGDISRTVVAEALATEKVTLAAVITSCRFDAPQRRWDAAASGTVVTVTVTSSDSKAGARRHVGLMGAGSMGTGSVRRVRRRLAADLPSGGNNPDTGRPENGLVVYRLYVDHGATPIRVPPQLVATPHYWIGSLH